MTEKEARILLNNLMIVAQKARSDITEGMCGDHQLDDVTSSLLARTNPILFGKIDLLNGIILTANQKTLEPIAVYNIFCLVDRSPAMSILCSFMHIKLPDLDRLPSWLGGWDEEV